VAPQEVAPNAPRPFRQLILKIHSRCNLSCDHCYVYTGVDQGWRHQPPAMSMETGLRVAQRIAEHARTHALSDFRVVLHGGEPLLAGPSLIDGISSAIRTLTPRPTQVRLAIQTNGVLLDERFLRLFHKHTIRVGVSLDGDRAANDRHRLFSNNRSSYPAVVRALTMLSQDRHRPLYSGLLCTVDLRNDPVATYESLLEHSPPRIDLLLPHANWTTRPPGLDRHHGATPYGDWLIAVFDRWYSAPRRETGIRLFDSIISRLLGGPTWTTALGSARGDLLTVETDGSIEASDSLKTAAAGAAATGMTVFTHTFDQALTHPTISTPASGPAGLCDTCRSCPVVSTCGGGLYTHRFSERNGFDNPSVYCNDLFRLIQHVRSRIEADLRDRTNEGRPVA
jgi:uncharacterized protein